MTNWVRPCRWCRSWTGLRVREPSTNPRRNTIVRLLRGEATADRGTDVPAALAEQLLALVTEQCASRPTILVVDDLQWADPASVTLWGRLARSARQVPLLLIGMMRPVPLREDLLALRRAVADADRLQLDRAHRAGRGGPDRGAGGRQTGHRPAAAGRRRGGQPALPHRAGGRAGPQLQPDPHGRGHRRAGGRFGAQFPVRGHRRPARLRDRGDPGGAEGRGPAGHGVRGARPGHRAAPERGRPDPGGGRGLRGRRAGRVRQRAGVPASIDPGGAVRRDAGAGPRGLAPGRGPGPGRGGRAAGPGRAAAAAGRRRPRGHRGAGGRLDAGLAEPAPRTRWSVRRPGWRRNC